MIKKIIMFSLASIIVFLLVNSYYTVEYGVSIYSYYFDGQNLTDEELTYLKEKGVLNYGADYNAPPLKSVNDASGQYEGVIIDYLNALSLEIGVNIKTHPMLWHEALDALKEGTIDICDMHPSKARSEYFDFTIPVYHQSGSVLVNRSQDKIHTLDELEGTTIAAIKDDYVIEHVKATYKNVTICEYNDLKQAVEALTLGKVDAVLGEESVLHYHIVNENLANRFKMLDASLYEREAVFGVPKGNALLLSILNKSIKRLERKQTMTLISKKWSPLITKDDSSKSITKLIQYALLIILLISLFFYLWNSELKIEVSRQTYALRQSNNILETTFNGLTNHLLLLVDENCHVVETNHTFCQFIGLKRQDVIGKHCHAIEGLLGTVCTDCPVKTCLETQEINRREVQFQNRLFAVQAYPLEPDMKHFNSILLMFEDITELKLSEQQLRQSSKMAAIGQLSAGIAHEIRTPLGIIRNSAYLLKKMSTDEKALKSVETIENATTRANKIIDNLLNFSRISDYERMTLNIKAFISDLLKLNEKVFKDQNIKVVLKVPFELESSLYPEPLKHILINLIDNAKDAMAEGGDGGTLTIVAESLSPFLIITIKDTGLGIAPEHLDTIFDPFFTTKPQGKGTGLGLYIAYNEAKKIGGHISVDETSGSGTCFKLTLNTEQKEIAHESSHPDR
ncbi:transporter substrate-binding domain-containing protein [Fusibacter sp. 3D3]|uniref:transporter substrate-binding domain-containing protein n=1 Tax=Fusibacter sp. 3D3 TaxID=1048380 RepID=UPI000852F5CC|nr:transporter substrate-binding domain-containing protein [Fusibacter sp. 3D3]GAU79979.1 two-component sensor histidine kinase [Fusibacter sp. 3D3]